MRPSDKELLQELIQIRPQKRLAYDQFIKHFSQFDLNHVDVDLNRWSRVHPRFESHPGCIVDLGCLGWNKSFSDIDSDNWAGYFFGKKRVIGVDPQESPNLQAELFKGFVANFTGKASLRSEGIIGSLVKDPKGKFDVIDFRKFRQKFKIDEISILKINIEGSEWGLIESFSASDLDGVDQICISFHDFLLLGPNARTLLGKVWQFNPMTKQTLQCIQKLESFGYRSLDLGIYGWRIFLKDR